MKFSSLISILVVVLLVQCGLAADNTAPEGFKALFSGKDLSGWKGLVANPAQRAKMTPSELAEKQKMADERMRAHWSAQDGVLVFDGKGDNLCTDKDYGDFEMFVDWKIQKAGDSGIYVRGTPQIQIWDADAEPQNAVGSGGLFNNQKNPSKPSKRADKPIGEWNTFRIRMVGEKVSVWLNGELVVDNVTLENYWERAKPIYPTGQIELQNHGNPLYFKNIYIKELK
jgi:3-keto-disaccharide hydrolase